MVRRGYNLRLFVVEAKGFLRRMVGGKVGEQAAPQHD